MINLKLQQVKEIYNRGYTLDSVYLLSIIEDIEEARKIPKLALLEKTLLRKGLILEGNKVTLAGQELLKFLEGNVEKISERTSVPSNDFDKWWKTFPGTDTFTYKGKSFEGTRSLRTKKDECKAKLEKIIAEGEYTMTDLIDALHYEVTQKKENSIKTKSNRLTYMQNSLTYLNQRTFEPFIELIREGRTVKEETPVSGGTDI